MQVTLRPLALDEVTQGECLFIQHWKILTKSLLCARRPSQSGETAVNKGDKSSDLKELMSCEGDRH